MIRHRGGPVCGLLLLLLAVGCVSGGAARGGADPATSPQGAAVPATGSVVQVYNTAPSAVRVTVYIVPEVGVETSLGAVEAGRQASLPFDGPPGRYHLRAVGSTGTVESETFQFYRNSQARWDMNINQVHVSGRR